MRPTGKIKQSKSRLQEVILSVICMCFIFLFVYTGYDKLMHLERFTAGIQEVPYLGKYAGLIALLVPVTEIIIALLLIIPKTSRLGLHAATALMLVFTIYLAWMILFSDHKLCNCGGVLESLGWTEHLVFNICFFLIGLWAIRLNIKNKNHEFYREN